MGLDKNDGRYLWLRVSSSHIYALLLVDFLQHLVRGYIMEHLSIKLSITKQKSGVVERVICLVHVYVALMKYSFF